jgi:hypothetical protein
MMDNHVNSVKQITRDRSHAKHHELLLPLYQLGV